MSLRGTIAASLLLLLPPILAACSREPPSAEEVRASGATFTAEVGSTRPPGWPSRVLITNDDGITAPGLAALVRAFSAMTEVVVVAPAGNRSGSTSYASILSGTRGRGHRDGERSPRRVCGPRLPSRLRLDRAQGAHDG